MSGGMVLMSNDNMTGGIFAAVFGIFITLMLFFAVALPAEKTMTVFENSTDVFNIDEKWNSYENASFMMSLMYVSICCPALAGIGVMILAILKKQRRDVEEYGMSEMEWV